MYIDERWHLSQHIGFVQEHELILNKSGLPHELPSEQLEQLWICEKHRRDMNIHTISGFRPERTFVEAASHQYSCSGFPKIGNPDLKIIGRKFQPKLKSLG